MLNEEIAEQVWVLVGTITYETADQLIGVYRSLEEAARASKDAPRYFDRLHVIEQRLGTGQEGQLNRVEVVR